MNGVDMSCCSGQSGLKSMTVKMVVLNVLW